MAFDEVVAFDLPKYKAVEVALRGVALHTGPAHMLFGFSLAFASRQFAAGDRSWVQSSEQL